MTKSKKYFYCWFFGSIETNDKFIKEQLIEIAPRLVFKLRQFNNNVNSNNNVKITLKLNDNELCILNQNKTTVTLKYSNIVYVEKTVDNNSFVSLIFIKSVGRKSIGNITKKVLTAEIYTFKFDSYDAAKQLEFTLKEYIQLSKKYKKIIINQLQDNFNNSTATTLTTSKTNSSNTSNDGKIFTKVPLVENVAREFKEKLKQEKPILYPPKDYDTVMRNRGDLKSTDERRSLNPLIVGYNRAKYDDIESIDEDAKRVLRYYDDVLDSILPSSEIKTPSPPPIPLTQQPSYEYSNYMYHDNIKMNPLLINELKNVGKNLFHRQSKSLSPRTHTQQQQQQQQQTSNGFRTGAFQRLGNYAPKWMPNTNNNDYIRQPQQQQHATIPQTAQSFPQPSKQPSFLYKRTANQIANSNKNLSQSFTSLRHSNVDDHESKINNNQNQFILKPDIYSIKENDTNEMYANRRTFKPIVVLDNDLELYSDVYY